MPANKRKSKSTTKAKAKPNVRGVLIQREIPTIPHGIPFISNFHRGEKVKAELVMAGLPPIIPPTGFWRDYKFSTYSTKLVEPEFVTTIQNLDTKRESSFGDDFADLKNQSRIEDARKHLKVGT